MGPAGQKIKVCNNCLAYNSIVTQFVSPSIQFNLLGYFESFAVRLIKPTFFAEIELWMNIVFKQKSHVVPPVL